MATGESGQLLRANEIEDMLEKRSEEYQRIKANYEKWRVDQQQKLQTETEKLQNELGQLRKNLDDAGMEHSRATKDAKELGQLFSRPLMHRDDSPDIEELFAEAERWNSDFYRIRETHDRPGEDKTAIMRNIEKIQNKLEALPAAYDFVRKEETRKVRKQLRELWQPQSQPGSLTTNLSNDTAQRQTRLLRGTSPLAAEELSPAFSAEAHQQIHKRSREVSLEIISPTEFRQSIPRSTRTRVPDTSGTSGVSMITPQREVTKPYSNAAMLFRDRHEGYQAERARATTGRHPFPETPQEYQNLGLAPSPAFSRFGPVDTDFFPNAFAEGTRANKESQVIHRVENAKNRLTSTQKSQSDNDTIIVTSVHSGRRQLPNSHNTQTKKRQQSQVSSSDSESDLPLATRRKKAETTVHFDQVNAENKNWRQGEKIYKITEYHLGSDDWYIFRCESHCTGLANAREAAKHLQMLGHGQGLGHGNAPWTSPQAVKELGVRVVGCNSEKRRRNNEAFELAKAEGYRSNRRCNNSNCPIHGTIGGPHRHSNLSQRQQAEVLGDSDSHLGEVYSEMPRDRGGDARVPEVWQQPNTSPIVLDPVPGELYQAYWISDHCWYPATVLPWGDLGEVGLAGSLDETALFKEKLPTCFAVEASRDGLRIVGWKRDFESHHRRASERKFPCMFFEGISAALPEDDDSPRPFENLAWVMAKHLRPIKYRHPDDHLFKANGLAEAEAFRQRVIRLKNMATREKPRSSQPLVDDDSDVFDVYEESRPKKSTQDKSVKTEPDSDYGF